MMEKAEAERGGLTLTPYQLSRDIREAIGFKLMREQGDFDLGVNDARDLVAAWEGLEGFENTGSESLVAISEGRRLLANAAARGEAPLLCEGIWPLLLCWQEAGADFVSVRVRGEVD